MIAKYFSYLFIQYDCDRMLFWISHHNYSQQNRQKIVSKVWIEFILGVNRSDVFVTIQAKTVFLNLNSFDWNQKQIIPISRSVFRRFYRLHTIIVIVLQFQRFLGSESAITWAKRLLINRIFFNSVCDSLPEMSFHSKNDWLVENENNFWKYYRFLITFMNNKRYQR